MFLLEDLTLLRALRALAPPFMAALTHVQAT